MNVTVLRSDWTRPVGGPEWSAKLPSGLAIGGRAWQSNGGPGRRHPAKALPFSLEVLLPEPQGQLLAVSLVGVFALFGDSATEPLGAIGATLQVEETNQTLWRTSLIQGRHYGSTNPAAKSDHTLPDGVEITKAGEVMIDGDLCCVEVLRFPVETAGKGKRLVFRDLGTPASFVIFDVLFEYEVKAVCPFRGHGSRISLSEVGRILRLRDRSKFEVALGQLQSSVGMATDLDEAKGMALTFIAVVCAAMLDLEESKPLHQVQLSAARQLEGCEDAAEVARVATEICVEVVRELVPTAKVGDDPLIAKSLSILEKHYSEEISDQELAEKLGLSTSHFRFLFREQLGQPFHKYLVSLRLEKARDMLMMGRGSVGDVAEKVGFTSAAHFTRAFTKRFGAAPSSFRQRRVPEG